MTKKAIVCYITHSGNTEEVAELIYERLIENNYEADMYEIGFGQLPDLSQYNKIFIGTFTWDEGATPDEVKDFVREIGYKPDNIYVYGTGETQFGGEEMFCLAAVKLAKFYNSPVAPLKIEQSPRGSQEKKVNDWVNQIINKKEMHV